MLTLHNVELFCINHGDQRVFFKFEIIIKVLFSSFCFIWIPMLWVYGHYKYFNSYSAAIVFTRQNLTSVDVRRFWRIKTVPALRGLEKCFQFTFYRVVFCLPWFSHSDNEVRVCVEAVVVSVSGPPPLSLPITPCTRHTPGGRLHPVHGTHPGVPEIWQVPYHHHPHPRDISHTWSGIGGHTLTAGHTHHTPGSHQHSIKHWDAEILLYNPWRPKGLLKFEIIINVLVSSVRFIWIPMVWVYGHYY